jgi:hypothetical protein
VKSQVNIREEMRRHKKRLIDYEQDFILYQKCFKHYLPVQKLWHPGNIYKEICKFSTRWRPGMIYFHLNRYRQFRKPDRGLAYFFPYWVLKKLNTGCQNTVEVMFGVSIIAGGFAFWELTPQVLLEVDPTLILQPEKVKILKEVVLHKGCVTLNIDEGQICTCIDDPNKNMIANDFQSKSANTNEIERKHGRSAALAITIVTIITGIMLNSVVTTDMGDPL